MRTAEDDNDMRLLLIVTSTIVKIYACLLPEGGEGRIQEGSCPASVLNRYTFFDEAQVGCKMR